MSVRPGWCRFNLSLVLLVGCVVGCGGYEARLQQRIQSLGPRKGTPNAVPDPTTTPAAVTPQTTVDGRLFASPYTIYDSAGTKTGVTLYLPKEFVNADGSANFTNTETLGAARLTPPGAQTSVMTYFYADTSGKKLPAIITFFRMPAGAVQNADDRARAEGAMLAAAQKVAAPGSNLVMESFPTAGLALRKFTYNQRSKFPVGDINAATEDFDSRIDTYALMTTGEGVVIQITAPTSVSNTFDFFGAAEAGLRLMIAGPPTVTGTVP